ncbi:MAG: IS630 transposase-related protein [Oscillospiraceae bacterium]|jgi:transposase|nr:IS630 transposase-related protein [Oscillospiraceae bacterium]
MSYSKDLREKVMEFIEKGHTRRAAAATFGISVSTIQKWHDVYSKTGTVEKKELDRKPRKFESESLRAYIAAQRRFAQRNRCRIWRFNCRR